MDTSPLTPILPGQLTASTSTTTTNTQAAAADFDSFLTLLTAQLRNQDPLSPLDSTEFVAQLASFSTVEQLIGTNDRLDALGETSLSNGISSLASWIGRDVIAVDGGFRAVGGPISFNVPTVAGSDLIEAKVVDAQGATIRTFQTLPDEQGMATWDGLDDAGRVVPPADLSLQLTYRQDGATVAERTGEVPREVIGVRGTAGGLLLELADGGVLAPELVGRLNAKVD